MSRFTLLAASLLFLSPSLAKATDFSNVKSGLLLGVYASPDMGGMKVTGIIPGYSAEGRLQPSDILMRATVDGTALFPLRSTFEMEKVKSAIGPNQEAAVEILRPGVGLLYAWIEFTPIASPAAYTTQSKAMFQMESEKPGAREMFHSSDVKNSHTRPPKPAFSTAEVTPAPMPFVPENQSDRSAARLFGKK